MRTSDCIGVRCEMWGERLFSSFRIDLFAAERSSGSSLASVMFIVLLRHSHLVTGWLGDLCVSPPGRMTSHTPAPPTPTSHLIIIFLSPDCLHSWSPLDQDHLGPTTVKANYIVGLATFTSEMRDRETPPGVVSHYRAISLSSLKYLDNWMPGRVGWHIIAAETLTGWPFTNPPPVWLARRERPP